MKIFILEDSGERVNIFFSMFDQHDVVVANCAKTACKILSEEKFDRIFLDHDLGGLTFVDSDDENTGYQVAKHIPSTMNNEVDVVIHSWNGSGAMQMENALRSHEDYSGKTRCIMFGGFDKDILYN
jgi:hypothetical protein